MGHSGLNGLALPKGDIHWHRCRNRSAHICIAAVLVTLPAAACRAVSCALFILPSSISR